MSASQPLRVPVQLRSQRTRAVLVDAARAEFGERGYAPTTARSIAQRAGVGTGTFYHYFPDKDAVLREIAAERGESMLRRSLPLGNPPAEADGLTALARDGKQRLRQLVELYVDHHRAERGLHSVITERRLCDAELERIMRSAERTAVERLRDTLVRWNHDGDCETAAFMMFSLLEGAVHGHVLCDAFVSDERFISGLSEALLRIGLPSTLSLLSGPSLPDSTS